MTTKASPLTREMSLPGDRIDAGKRRVLISSVIGSVIEWYDYTLYGVAAALVFNHLFSQTSVLLLAPSRHSARSP